MTDIVLHHYPPSPVSEKIRVALGILKADWKSVEIPRVPPKPDVLPLTGGYRRTPIMQIGADIYCDSQCILSELTNRFPTLNVGSNANYADIINHWTDHIFKSLVQLAIGASAEELPKDFLADRTRLFFGPQFDLEVIKKTIPHLAAQIRSHFTWAENVLSDERLFFHGDTASMSDACFYYLPWFIRRRWAQGEAFMKEFKHLEIWESRVKDIGHGSPSEMSSLEAIELAKSSAPIALDEIDNNEAQGLSIGDSASIVFDADSGETPVIGEIEHISANRISIRHQNERVGMVCIHFPRNGYRVEKVN